MNTHESLLLCLLSPPPGSFLMYLQLLHSSSGSEHMASLSMREHTVLETDGAPLYS